MERAFNWPFFDRDAWRRSDALAASSSGSSAIPRSTSSFIPAAGMMSMIVADGRAQTSIVGYRLIVLAMHRDRLPQHSDVWAHHMFATGLPPMST
jgi:cytochrome c oxidase subunit I+III